MKKATGYGPNEGIARTAFKEGQELFQQKKFAEAAEKFKTAADRWPDTPLEEDALFMLGESQFFSDQYSKAHDTYGLLLKKYNNSRHLDVAVQREFALGRYWEQLDDYQHAWSQSRPILPTTAGPCSIPSATAIQAYQNVRMYDPTGPLADDSLMATAIAYFRRGQFENAALDFDLLRKEYPNSEHQKARSHPGTASQNARIPGQILRSHGLKRGRRNRRSDPGAIRHANWDRNKLAWPRRESKFSKKRPTAITPWANTTKNKSITARRGCIIKI